MPQMIATPSPMIDDDDVTDPLSSTIMNNTYLCYSLFMLLIIRWYVAGTRTNERMVNHDVERWIGMCLQCILYWKGWMV